MVSNGISVKMQKPGSLDHSSSYQSFYKSINHFINQSINQSINQTINQHITNYQSTYQSINRYVCPTSYTCGTTGSSEARVYYWSLESWINSLLLVLIVLFITVTFLLTLTFHLTPQGLIDLNKNQLIKLKSINQFISQNILCTRTFEINLWQQIKSNQKNIY